MTRLALVGAGLIGQEHATLIARHAGATLAAICDPAPTAVATADRLGVPLHADLAAMLDQCKPDGVIVASPNQMHRAAAIACIERGIPCLVEKPLADTVEAAFAIVQASEQSGVPVLVGHQRRHSPDIRAAKRTIDEGALGPLVAVSGMTLFDKPDRYFVDWRKQAGGGVLLINLIHDIDVLRWLVGEIDSVQAFTSSAVRGFEVEDTASLAIRFRNGALGSFVISDAAVSPWAWEYTSGQALYHPTQPGAALFLAGRKGALSVSDLYLWRHADPDGDWQDPLVREHRPVERSLTYVNQLDHFLDVVKGAVAPLISARDGMMTLAATLAIARAGRENRAVAIAEMLADAGVPA
ncbi:Gfo/Idh/MocA family protein [Alsobacter metallidurans]|nr:Gfo/Idh/MocA family oxidoreductase [Alsobacter metallidurans]